MVTHSYMDGVNKWQANSWRVTVIFLQIHLGHQPPDLIRPQKDLNTISQYTLTLSLACYFLLTTCPFTQVGTSRSKGLNFEKCIHKMLWYIVTCIPARLCTRGGECITISCILGLQRQCLFMVRIHFLHTRGLKYL